MSKHETGATTSRGMHSHDSAPKDQKDPVTRTLTTADGNDRATHCILRVCRAIQRGQTNWMRGNIDAQARMDGNGGRGSHDRLRRGQRIGSGAPGDRLHGHR